jgi:hypothetical protein
MGFCQFDRDIEVWGKQKMYVNIPCVLEGIDGLVTLFGVLQPDLQNYSLLLKPIELYTPNKIYRVVAGYTLNAERTNPNIASEINTRAIETILAKTGADTAQTVKDTVKDIAKSQQTQVTINGDTVIKQTNLSFSVLGETALWTGVASLVQNISDYIQKQTSSIPVTFKIKRGTMVFVNLIIQPEEVQIQSQPQNPQKPQQPVVQPVVQTVK